MSNRYTNRQYAFAALQFLAAVAAAEALVYAATWLVYFWYTGTAP